MNSGSCWPSGSYFGDLVANYTYCVHTAALDGVNDGGWIYPDGTPCTSSTSPIECNTIATDGPTNITMQRLGGAGMFMETAYKCCLPNGCDDGPTDVIIANIYGKLHLISLHLIFDFEFQHLYISLRIHLILHLI